MGHALRKIGIEVSVSEEMRRLLTSRDFERSMENAQQRAWVPYTPAQRRLIRHVRFVALCVLTVLIVALLALLGAP